MSPWLRHSGDTHRLWGRPEAPSARSRPITGDAVEVAQAALHVIPFEDGAAAGPGLRQRHVQIAGVRVGLRRHRLERQHLMDREVCGDTQRPERPDPPRVAVGVWGGLGGGGAALPDPW